MGPAGFPSLTHTRDGNLMNIQHSQAQSSHPKNGLNPLSNYDQWTMAGKQYALSLRSIKGKNYMTDQRTKTLQQLNGLVVVGRQE